MRASLYCCLSAPQAAGLWKRSGACRGCGCLLLQACVPWCWQVTSLHTRRRAVHGQGRLGHPLLCRILRAKGSSHSQQAGNNKHLLGGGKVADLPSCCVTRCWLSFPRMHGRYAPARPAGHGVCDREVDAACIHAACGLAMRLRLGATRCWRRLYPAVQSCRPHVGWRMLRWVLVTAQPQGLQGQQLTLEGAPPDHVGLSSG